MTTPSLPVQLETSLDDLELAQNTLTIVLDHALHSALHPTYTAAIKRILAFNKQAIESTENLLTVLKRRARQPHP